jgi:hypothetical protein
MRRYRHTPHATLAQVLPSLGDVPPEARLNMAVHHLRCGKVAAADALLRDVSPSTPHEYILKVWPVVGFQLVVGLAHFQSHIVASRWLAALTARVPDVLVGLSSDLQGIVALLLGQASGSQEQLKAAQQHFQVGHTCPLGWLLVSATRSPPPHAPAAGRPAGAGGGLEPDRVRHHPRAPGDGELLLPVEAV